MQLELLGVDAALHAVFLACQTEHTESNVGHHVNEAEITCASSEGKVNTTNGGCQSFTHRSLDLVLCALVCLKELVGETLSLLVVLDRECHVVAVLSVEHTLVESANLLLIIEYADQLAVETRRHRVTSGVVADHLGLGHVSDPEVLRQVFEARVVGLIVFTGLSVESLENEAASQLVNLIVEVPSQAAP